MTAPTHSRRFTDLVCENNSSNYDSLAKASKSIGKRSTDTLLSKKYTKESQSGVISHTETFLKPNDLIISRSDLQGTIIQCNNLLASLSGWSQEELLGSNHNVLRHPDMPKALFKIIWGAISAKKEFYGYIKNLRKDGGFYWTFAYITADINRKREITGYTSYRRFAPKLTIEAIEPIYKILIKAEEQGGLELSETLFQEYLEKTGFGSYDKLIVDLQIKASLNSQLDGLPS
ncbi:MAG: PAS domain-containing protein [Cocleimonas sp.]